MSRRSAAFVEMVAERGVACGLLRPWPGLSLRALALSDRESWPGKQIEQLRSETTQLARQTGCDAGVAEEQDLAGGAIILGYALLGELGGVLAGWVLLYSVSGPVFRSVAKRQRIGLINPTVDDDLTDIARAAKNRKNNPPIESSFSSGHHVLEL